MFRLVSMAGGAGGLEGGPSSQLPTPGSPAASFRPGLGPCGRVVSPLQSATSTPGKPGPCAGHPEPEGPSSPVSPHMLDPRGAHVHEEGVGALRAQAGMRPLH